MSIKLKIQQFENKKKGFSRFIDKAEYYRQFQPINAKEIFQKILSVYGCAGSVGVNFIILMKSLVMFATFGRYV